MFGKAIAALFGLVLMAVSGSANAALMWEFETTGGTGTFAFSEPRSTDSGAAVTDFTFNGTCTDCDFELADLTSSSWEIDNLWNIVSLELVAANGINEFLLRAPNVFGICLDLDLCRLAVSEITFTAIEVPEFDVPEPATLGLFAIGLAGIGVMSRRRRKQIAAG